jgi:hypothetical protein
LSIGEAAGSPDVRRLFGLVFAGFAKIGQQRHGLDNIHRLEA